ncbi:chemerin-like receptor 1 [Sphaerodactylus townsendi]|uniref:chemerin-like receptor 1 n=1 Tax=Sphaerodactylus townsendi TaxID=933632 RepID=UPI002025EDE8|nr:chemerin-like receptor 1 [Sphaerodactylus townsendi]
MLDSGLISLQRQFSKFFSKCSEKTEDTSEGESLPSKGMEDTTQLDQQWNCPMEELCRHKCGTRRWKSFVQKGWTIAFMVSLWCCLPAGLVSGNGLVISSSPGFPYEEDGPNTIWFPQLGHHELSPLHPSSSCRVINIVYLAQGFHWSLGEAMCKFNHTLTFVNLYASIHFLMVISIDRCISVICPVWTRNHRRPRLACFVALGVWIWAMVLSSPYIHFRKTVKNGDEIYCYDKYSDNVEQAKVIHCVMVISRFIFTFVIPFPVIIFCYGAIVLRLRRDRLASSSKPFKVIMAVILAFFICWFPFHVFSFLNIQGYEDHSLHLPLIIGNTLAYSLTLINSCLNPILYVFMVHDFKKKLKSSILSQVFGRKAFLPRDAASQESRLKQRLSDPRSGSCWTPDFYV